MFKKLLQNISSIITQALMLFTIPWLWISLCYLIPPLTPLGLFFLRFFEIIKNCKGDAFPIMKSNLECGCTSTSYYTKNVEIGTITNSYGAKIGSITAEETGEYESTDYRRWVFVSPQAAIIYVLIYPFIRIVAFIFSILALFTNKFYVQISQPEDYSKSRYNEFLLCYFDVVYKRNGKNIREENKQNIIRQKSSYESKKEKRIDPIITISSIILPSIAGTGFVIAFFGVLTSLSNPKRLKACLKYLKLFSIILLVYAAIVLGVIIAIRSQMS